MRQLGDQWVEEIDGKRHILKAVANEKKNCNGCVYGRDYNKDSCLAEPKYPCGYLDFIIKDLGVLNEDGCLPSPWGGYPKIVRVGREDLCTYKVRFYLKNEVVYGFTLIEVTGNTRQEVIDAWNRRV